MEQSALLQMHCYHKTDITIHTALKGKVSSKMTYNFYWPDRISISF